MDPDVLKFNFTTACMSCTEDNVRKIVSRDDFDPRWITDKYKDAFVLFYVCHFGYVKIVEILLDYVDVIPLDCLIVICINTHRADKYLKIIQLLLQHDNFNKPIPSLSNLISNQESYFNNQIKILFDEYMFRIDGPKYNENMM